MSWLVRRAVALLGIGAAVGITSALVWPGDPDGSLSAAHLLGLGGFLLTAVLLLLAAGFVFFAVIGGTWKASDFTLTEFLERLRRRR